MQDQAYRGGITLDQRKIAAINRKMKHDIACPGHNSPD
jgi:hypothetical protein